MYLSHMPIALVGACIIPNGNGPGRDPTGHVALRRMAWGRRGASLSRQAQPSHARDRFDPGALIGHHAAGQSKCVGQAVTQHYRYETAVTLVAGRGMGEGRIQQPVGCTPRHEATPWSGRWDGGGVVSSRAGCRN
jgi:hypothetical protein